MTRSEFIRAYARASMLPEPKFAKLGIIDVGGNMLFAMPCACGGEGCLGWALISSEQVATHLTFHAPDALRTAYRMAVEAAGGE